MAIRISEELLKRALYVRLGQEWLRITKRIVGSETLRDAMQLEVLLQRNEIALSVPHYWAVPYHEGHGPVEGTKMIFFPNKADDPRTGGGKAYPVRASDIRSLTPEEFKSLKGLYRVIFSRKRVEKGAHFFPRGARALVTEGAAAQIVTETLDEFVKINLPEERVPAAVLVI